ncbi:AbrB family transcriptional regulator [Streptococcus ovuberis]|uniref:AbrB family transcriptional regulator n=1 Tax=Streptococcus ovuberis TaxID=1936207 RepID=A0A7X6S102_9STRE|nr:AbrB family transcriptional regulator [Streptococcus ovuberis]NKZ20659.1 AbrB family transcriptional regulator [Streptococcus ovuberis]
MSLLITLLVGTFGGLVAKKLKFPAPFMIGSMIAVAVVSMLSGNMVTTKAMKIIAQIISGAYIGQTIKQEDFRSLPGLGKIIVLLMGLFTLNTFLMGLVFIQFFGMTPVTAFLSCLPGGIMDVSLMAVDMGAQADIVATVQTARLMGILMILPLWISFWTRRLAAPSEAKEISSQRIQKAKKGFSRKQWLTNVQVLTVATIGGIIGRWTGLPVGTLIFALLFSSCLKLRFHTRQLSSPIRYLAQIFAGSMIGTSFTRSSISQMVHLIVPVLLLLSSYLLINLVFGLWLSKRGMLDLQSALFASSPAGATDLTLMAGDLGGDMAKIAVIQISRILYTVVLMPLMVKLLLTLF